MINIAQDTPKELLQLARKIAPGQLSQKEIESMVINELMPLVNKILKKRTDKPVIIQLEADPRLQPLANLINRLDFSGINKLAKKMALGYIKKYLKNNNLL